MALPYLKDWKICGQDEGFCGQACVTVARLVLGQASNVNRALFVKEQNCVFSSIEANDASNVTANLNSLVYGSIDGQIKDLSEILGRDYWTGLGIVRLKWAGCEYNLRSNRHCDEEHYVLVHKVTQENVEFWEPSFNCNSRETFDRIRREDSSISHHLGFGSPFWEMSKSEFVARNSKLQMLQETIGKVLILS